MQYLANGHRSCDVIGLFLCVFLGVMFALRMAVEALRGITAGTDSLGDIFKLIFLNSSCCGLFIVVVSIAVV